MTNARDRLSELEKKPREHDGYAVRDASEGQHVEPHLRSWLVAEQQNDRRHVADRAGAVDDKGDDSCTTVLADRDSREEQGERADQDAKPVQDDKQHIEDGLLEHERIGDAEAGDEAESDAVSPELGRSQRAGEQAGWGEGTHGRGDGT